MARRNHRDTGKQGRTVLMQSETDLRARMVWSDTGCTDRILNLGFVKNCFLISIRYCPRNCMRRRILKICFYSELYRNFNKNPDMLDQSVSNIEEVFDVIDCLFFIKVCNFSLVIRILNRAWRHAHVPRGLLLATHDEI